MNGMAKEDSTPTLFKPSLRNFRRMFIIVSISLTAAAGLLLFEFVYHRLRANQGRNPPLITFAPLP
jgi:hypothetical protein